jgi:hypothetical protein
VPFTYLGDEENFIASMLDFVGGQLPKEWDEKYHEIHKRSGREWGLFESKVDLLHAAKSYSEQIGRCVLRLLTFH